MADRFRAGPAEQWSTRIGFFIAGFGMAAWAPLVVYAKARAGLDDGRLGLLLLCLGGGSIVAMPLAGALAARFGCRRVLAAGTLGICATLPLLATLERATTLGATLLAFGACVGSVDCAVNTQAVIVERAAGRALMSGFHGLFSVGGILGAGSVSALLSIGASPLVAVLGVVALTLAALAVAAPHWLGGSAGGGGSGFALPRGIVLLIGALCFVVFLTEGAMLDWSAVFLTSVRGVASDHAGLGYAVFATAMTAGRLSGDRIVHRLGGVAVVLAGSLCAALGLALLTAVPNWAAALLGCLLVGAGCSNIVPVLYSALGRQRTMPEHAAVAAITTLGYAGILAGPAGIGFVSHATSLPIAFAALAVLLGAVAACAIALKPIASPPAGAGRGSQESLSRL